MTRKAQLIPKRPLMFILGITPDEGFDAVRWEAVLNSGLDALMIREKQMSARDLLFTARWVRERYPQIELWVNGRLDVALAVGAGLHGPEAYPEIPGNPVPLSRPIHSEDQIPSRLGCQQLLVAPIFEVPGKGAPWGVERLHRALDEIPVGPRVLALGGINPENAAALRHPRLSGIALIGALWGARDPSRAVEALRLSWT